MQVIEQLRTSETEADRLVADGYMGTIVENMKFVEPVYRRAIDEMVGNRCVASWREI